MLMTSKNLQGSTLRNATLVVLSTLLLLSSSMAKQLASLGQWVSPISSQLIVSKVRLLTAL